METSEISQKVKDHRHKTGLSQEQLANESGLNLRTIQRIENGETVPRGDTLRRLAVALNTSPDELIDWKTKEDKNVLTVLTLSQLSFIAFPILGIIIPLIIWILQKDKVRRADELGKTILNFQISWVFVFFTFVSIAMFFKIQHYPLQNSLPIFLLLAYGYNFLIIVVNLVMNWKDKGQFYKPSFKFLS